MGQALSAYSKRQPGAAWAATTTHVKQLPPVLDPMRSLSQWALVLAAAVLLTACELESLPGELPQTTLTAPTAVLEPSLALDPTQVPDPTLVLDPVQTAEPTLAMEAAPAVEPTLALDPVINAEPTLALEPVLTAEPTLAVPGINGDKAVPLLTGDGFSFQVELALTPEQITRGLSYRDSLPPGTGMLFVYPDEAPRSFWMFEMRFPLDMVWIGGDCAVVDITENAPPPEPGQASSELPLFSPKDPARYVFEINAGEARQHGVGIGDRVEFDGSIKGLHGC